MYTDWRCSSIICETCLSHYGSNHLRYLGSADSIAKNRIEHILDFDPEVVLPSVEASHFHFEYSSSGYLKPNTQKGMRTINRFSLNRSELVERRLRLINKKNTLNDEFQYRDVESPVDTLFILGVGEEADIDFGEYLIKRIQRDYIFYSDFHQYTELPSYYQKFKPGLKTSGNKFHTDFSGISSIAFSGIRNFKNEQVLNLKGKRNIILLGENGVGKSTVLELIKRAIKPQYKRNLDDLCNNPDYLPLCEVTYEDKRYKIKYGTNKAFQGSRDQCNVVHISESRSSSINSKLLGRWISKQTDNEELIHWIARKLKTLLSLPQDYYFCTIDGNVYWETRSKNSGRFYLSEFSSGYNSILTIFYKVLSGITSENTTNTLSDILTRLSSTIVLIDEIELHLHPRFKKDIVKNLKDTFPEVIFIITTHEPLIIKSTDESDSIVVIEDINYESVITSDLPDHTFLTTEQILSSPIFGLGALEDSDLINDSLIHEYYDDLKNKKWEKVNIFRDRLGKSGYFGKTYRELIALSAVDAYLSNGKVPRIEDIVSFLTKVDSNEKD